MRRWRVADSEDFGTSCLPENETLDGVSLAILLQTTDPLAFGPIASSTVHSCAPKEMAIGRVMGFAREAGLRWFHLRRLVRLKLGHWDQHGQARLPTGHIHSLRDPLELLKVFRPVAGEPADYRSIAKPLAKVALHDC